MDTHRAGHALETKRNKLKRFISDLNVENCLVKSSNVYFVVCRYKL